MPVSASTLFHFTDTFEKLRGILNSNFHPKYCLENWQGTFPPPEDRLGQVAVPMVCFCDIPLSQIGDHIKDYGNYALGLSKEWARKMRLNPVIYLNPGSLVIEYIIAMFRATATMVVTGKSADLKRSARSVELLAFTKPYEGVLTRVGREQQQKVFYNEREWRYVP
jgi:hypothetical protein